MAINREKILGEAQKLIEKGKYDKALVELSKICTADPSDVRTLHKLGDLQLRMGLFAEAIDTYDGVARLYAGDGFAPKAIAVYKQMREILARQAPQLEERYGHIVPRLAALYQECGLGKEALTLYEQLANRLMREQRFAELPDVFAQIANLDSQNPLAHLRLAEARASARDIDGAGSAWTTAADLLAKQERPDDAIQVLERLLQHKPDVGAARTCAELYLARNRQGDATLALMKLQACFQANPKDVDVLLLIARAFDAVGQVEKGFEVRKQAAGIARDAGQANVFRDIVMDLLRVAPNDPVVRDLAQQVGAVGVG
jgi:tetratricopeptide (TPR) repeat protein